MDYCTTCRRTLNGVFVCPGCGAYAPDIAPTGAQLQLTPTTVAVMSDISHTREFDAFPGFADPDPAPDVAVDADAPVGPATRSATGRAARRRRLADWKKQRRRAVVASTVALVGGGLTLAFMPSSRPSASQAQASTTPEPVTAPSTSSGGFVDTGSEPDADRTRTHDPKHAERGTGRPSKDSKDAKDSNSPGSATAITPVDAPAKRTTSPQTTPDSARPTEDTQTQPESPSTPDSPPPTAETPTQQPNKPTQPAPPPPSAEEPTDDSGLCLLVLCVDVD
ncbi:hypothetical protein GCM10011583_40840 [Streptomyces camponoticapitis]|uniref:Uncharacterized protein n=1 Tax=Streptomyces camponoticapitis TaxID=1616125 RepID=A0ABQ2EEM3_9ACTN|nr:hypothetical protein [Streptomyces camponoticapitis]GGK04975.1 hypothetical protein GCM10011583_40840 [Streptomyces camponoticapitis]